jgi:alkylation response protein AidB-like acyl-CoA dehydrogenase
VLALAGIPSFIRRIGRTEQHEPSPRIAKRLFNGTTRHETTPREHRVVRHTIFEGTSEIQQLVISRAISGLRID